MKLGNFFLVGFKKLLRINTLIFLGLFLAIGYLQYHLIEPHLLYGFADVDWVFLYRFKNLPLFSVGQLIDEWKASGVYAYQTYYMGIQEIFYGLDYGKYHLTTNIFRFLSTITLFPVIFYLTKNKLLSVLTTVLYGVSYTAIGAMYTVVTSGIYLALTGLNLFFLLYIYMIKTNKHGWRWIIALFILFFGALILSTERLYPMFPLLVLIELFFVWRSEFKKALLIASAKRSLLIIVPLVLGLLYKPYAATNVQFLSNTKVLLERISEGNWQLLLVPFASLGSLFVPNGYWRYFGVVSDTDFLKYVDFYIFGSGITFILITFILSFVASKKPFLFIVKTLIPTFVLGLLSYVLVNHRLSIPSDIRMHYDAQIYLVPALIGQFAVFLGLAFFDEWRMSGYKNNLLFCAFFGLSTAFLFIFATWLPAEPGLIFNSVHRYLTIPGIGSSLFIASVLVLIFEKIRSIKPLKFSSFAAVLLLIPIIMINNQVTQDYFKSELEFTGTNGYEQQRMKNKLKSYLIDFDRNEPSLFYFDESQGAENGYFHETTLLAGFNYWMMFWDGQVLDSKVMPELMRSNLLCPGKAVPCLDKVREYLGEKEGRKGINFAKRFYLPRNIYAFRLVNREVVDIRDEFFREMNLSEDNE